MIRHAGLKSPPRRLWQSATSIWRPITPVVTPGFLHPPSRFKQMCSPGGTANQGEQGRVRDRAVWFHAPEGNAALLNQTAAFASLVGKVAAARAFGDGRKRVELKGSAEAYRASTKLFKGPSRSERDGRASLHAPISIAVPYLQRELLGHVESAATRR